MSDRKRQLHLGFTIWPTGFHPAGWRLERAIDDGNTNPTFLRDVARTAERGLFDFFFIGDQLIGLPEWQYARPNQVLRPEAIGLAGFIAAATTHLGIVVTVNTTYAEPYSTARALATLDHLSQGRIGWNVVTGEADESAPNFGRRALWDNARRYDWAEDFTAAVTELWDSWEDGARVANKATGEFVDERMVHRIEHRGDFFSVLGPLNVERPVQGQIPIVNAGRSERSAQLGARFSDIKFTNDTCLGLEGARAVYDDLKGRLAEHGRDPDDQYVIPGLITYVGRDKAEGHAIFREVHALTNTDYDLGRLSAFLGVDVAGYDLDADTNGIPELERLDDPEAARFVAESRANFGPGAVPLRELYHVWLRKAFFTSVAGGPIEIADFIQEWWEARAVDGFMIFPPYEPEPIERFVDLVVPELQRRGIYRTAYEGSTLRDHFDLPRPVSRYSAVPERA
ncbi:NtaA/DmoA family FMN-dependent monooxygenase [Conexibacter sp. CPCC 206217]|uniref:NtaA/DmoA family FMN-dependent monooxygenase n=1 Tax=Conexibacter sp. CPCC 206217 TaxID=3064574 RepID=UPI002720AFB1|nr:NtaA/DmoA family FMN-dependent monooxygenase [Conexibacter sp. CPCC 206217]MDO8208817.1 NtaA/DmoA family FMN-dependent monooxygenase [Conexibacter sp. CPCC 206217]